jgi:phosphatidylglycerophosphate synthase
LKKFLKDLFNIPNSVSMVRLVTTPFIAIFWLGFDMPVVALTIGVIAGISDLFDGILARKLNQITELGALIDQLGDLVFESTSLLVAIMAGDLWVGWLLIYLFREFTVMVIRAFVIGKGGSLPSTWIGKAKSSLLQWAFFLLYLGMILSRPDSSSSEWSIAGITPGPLLIFGSMISILTGLAVGLISGFSYLKAFALFYVDNIADKEKEGDGNI